MITRFRLTRTPHWTALVAFFGWCYLCLKPGEGPKLFQIVSAPRLAGQAYRAMRNLLNQNKSP